MIIIDYYKTKKTCTDFFRLAQTYTDLHRLALYSRILAQLLPDDIKGYCRIWYDYQSFFWKTADNNTTQQDNKSDPKKAALR